MCMLINKMFVLGYVPQKNRLFLINKALKISSYELLSSVIMAQREIVKADPGLTTEHPSYQNLKEVISQVPESHIGKVAKFLDSMNFKEIAYHVTVEEKHKFDLAMHLNKIEEAYEIACKDPSNYEKLRKIGDVSLKQGNIKLAEQWYLKSNDYNSLLLIYSSLGDAEGLENVGNMALNEKKYNIAFQCFYAIAMPDKWYEILVESERIPEAAMFARAYIPSKLSQAMKLWIEKTKGKPYVPANLTDIPENVPLFDLAVRIESVLSEYYSKEREPAYYYEAAYERHFKEIAGQVDSGEEVELHKPLVFNNEKLEPDNHEEIHTNDDNNDDEIS